MPSLLAAFPKRRIASLSLGGKGSLGFTRIARSQRYFRAERGLRQLSLTYRDSASSKKLLSSGETSLKPILLTRTRKAGKNSSLTFNSGAGNRSNKYRAKRANPGSMLRPTKTEKTTCCCTRVAGATSAVGNSTK